MRINILTSCTGQKRFSPDHQLTQADFLHFHDKKAFAELENGLADYKVAAAEMYTGQQHLRLMQGVRAFQKKYGVDSIDLWILSAGYGLIPAEQKIVPYECTFQGMRASEIDAWSTHLRIPQCARAFFARPADLAIVLLSEKYLRALQLDSDTRFAAPTLFFAGRNSQRYIRGKGSLHLIALSITQTRRFSCGFVGLKGELAKRFLLYLLLIPQDGLIDFLNLPSHDTLSILDHLMSR